MPDMFNNKPATKTQEKTQFQCLISAYHFSILMLHNIFLLQNKKNIILNTNTRSFVIPSIKFV